MGGRGSSSASAASGGAAKGEKKTASVNADKHRKYLAGELGTKVTKNDEFMMETVFPDMNYNKVRRSKSNTYAYADRVSKDGERINVMVSADDIKVLPRIRDVIPAIEAAGLEPARAVLTSSRDTHVCRFRHVPVV